MNAGLFSLLGIGILGVVLAATTLAIMVHRELGPFGGLEGGRKWLLAGALGLGIIAFSIKLAVIATLSSIPDRVIEPLITEHPWIRWSPFGDAGKDSARAGTVPAPGRYVWQALPQQAPSPADNPSTPEKVALGRRLFFDPRLSQNGQVACSSCHDVVGASGADGRPAAVGVGGATGTRNTPTVWNAAFQSVLFWDGRARSLEEQASGPMLNPLEMGMPSATAVEERVRRDPSYREDFARVFGPDQPVTIKNIVAAIAAYERTLITPDAPYDRFVRGDTKALDSAQLRGMALFQSTGCISCHSGPNFSGASFLGSRFIEGQVPVRIFPALATRYETRYRLTRDAGAAARGAERGVWRIPSLRNVALTAPYFHNGSVDNLEEAVRIMATVQLGAVLSDDPRAGRATTWSTGDSVLGIADRPVLSSRDVSDIVAFLGALSSDALVSRIGQRTRHGGPSGPMRRQPPLRARSSREG